MKGTLPFVSVVIPVRNEGARIAGCVRQLIEQTYPRDHMEILVVDGDSQDGTREVARGLASQNRVGPSIRVLANPKRQRSAALNLGIREARGDIVVRIDARTQVPPDYVERCVQTLERTGADNVGGVMKPVGRTPTQEAIGLAMSHPFGVGDARFRLGKRSGPVDTVYLGCFRRSVFERVGLFDEDAPVLSEDSEMNYRIRRAGGTVYLDTDITAFYEPRETLGALWWFYFRYGGARAGSVLKHRRLTAWRQAVPVGFVLSLFGLGLGGVVHRPLWSLLLMLAGLYTVTCIAVCSELAIRNRRPDLFVRLLLAFPCMHFAWAFGFLQRLIQRPKPGSYWPD